MRYIGGSNYILNFLLKVKHLLILNKKMPIKSNEVIEEIFLYVFRIQLIAKIGVYLFHDFIAKFVVQTKLLVIYCLDRVCAALLARIIDRIKLSF